MVSTFLGRCCNYFFDVWDAKISMQCLVVDIPWGVRHQSQSSGAPDVKLQLMVFCIQFVDGW